MLRNPNVSIKCEMCDKLLLGRIGTAEVSENYISFKGNMSLQLKNEVGMRYWVSVFDSPNIVLSFCDKDCLDDYCTLREKMREIERREQKQRMNQEEWNRGGGQILEANFGPLWKNNSSYSDKPSKGL